METMRLEDTDEFMEVLDRLDSLEKFGIYKTLNNLKAAAADNSKPYSLLTSDGRKEYSFVAGNFVGKADDISCVKLNGVELTVGALVNQSSNVINYDGRTIFDKLLENLSIKDFRFAGGARGNDINDDSNAINAAILFAALRGGGEIVFPESENNYFCGKPIFLASNVTLNLNGQTIRGLANQSLFRTGVLVNGNIRPITTFDTSVIVQNGRVFNGKIINAGIAFDLQTWIMGCAVYDICFENCRQGFVLRDCFYSVWRNLHTGPTGTDISHPFYHLAQANNAVIFDRVTCTVPWGWLIEGGTTAIVWNCCTFEGGELGFKFKGPADAMGLIFNGCYFEAVTGTLWDFTQGAAHWMELVGNYINGVDVIFDDGGTTGTSTLFGRFSDSNKIANIGGNLGTPFTFRGLMRVSAPRNFIAWEGEPEASTSLTTPPNWITGLMTRRRQFRFWVSDGATDVRAVAVQEAGITPRAYGGDVGTPFVRTIPFSAISIPSGSSVVASVTTNIVLQNNASVVHFIIAINDNAGVTKISGTIYGDFVDQRQGPDKPVSIAQTPQGKLILRIFGINNNNGASYLTGSVYLGR